MKHQCLFLVSHNLTIKSDTSCTMSMRTEQGRRDEVTLFKLKQKTFVLELQWGKSKGFILKTKSTIGLSGAIFSQGSPQMGNYKRHGSMPRSTA